MLIVGTDYIDTDSSFDTAIKAESGKGKLFVRAYATSGIALKTPAALLFTGSGYQATALAASLYARVGVAPEAIASGCTGWVQMRGFVSNVQAAATSLTGSVGHEIYWAGATGLGCSSSSYIGQSGCVALLAEDKSGGGSTTANMFLLGVWAHPAL
jgi:hypothetical protein